MEKKESSDGEASTMSAEFQAFCHLVDGERARRQLIEERQRRSSGKKESARSRTVTWNPTFEVEDFKMAAEDAQSDHDEPSSSIGRSSQLGGMEEERVLIGAKRMRELDPLCTTGEKRHKSNAGRGSECALDLNKIEESSDVGN